MGFAKNHARIYMVRIYMVPFEHGRHGPMQTNHDSENDEWVLKSRAFWIAGKLLILTWATKSRSGKSWVHLTLYHRAT